MKKALISPNEIVFKYDGSQLGARVCEVSDASFEVAAPLFWVDCDDSIIADQFYFDGTSILPIPVKPKPEPTTGGNPIVA